MSWPWNWFGTSDPIASLDIDPTLKDFLKKSGPEQYNPVQSTHPVDDRSYRAQVGLESAQNQERLDKPKSPQSTATDKDGRVGSENDTASEEQEKIKPLPKESLFQDGRYKEIWKHYRSEAELNTASKSDQEKLLDVVEAYKERQASLKKAAMENCADFQMAIHECFRTGGFSARMTMCRAESQALQRCITLQSRFLRALGYMSVWERTEEEAERVQMHADVLYQRMLEHERIREKAKQDGREPPELGSIFGTKEEREKAAWNLPGRKGSLFYDGIQDPEAKAEIKATFFKGLDEKSDEFELAKEKWDSDVAVIEAMRKRIGEEWYRDWEDRTKRYEQGTERIGDKVKRWFDMRQYPSENPFKNPQIPDVMKPRDSKLEEESKKS